LAKQIITLYHAAQKPITKDQHALGVNDSSGVNFEARRNAQIYVCGHFEGMGKGVDAALQDVLGKQYYSMLVDKGRYHRDLY